MVVVFTTTYAISGYHHCCCEFESRPGRGVQHYLISLSVTCDRPVVYSVSFGFLYRWNWPPRYNWNIVESGVKQHQTNNLSSFPYSWRITGFVARVIRRVPHAEQELFTLPEHLISLQIFSGVLVIRSLIFCVLPCGSVFCAFVIVLFDHCIVCYRLTYGFWLTFGIFILFLRSMIEVRGIEVRGSSSFC